MKNLTIFFIAIISLFSLSGCEKFLQVEPKSTIAEDELFGSLTGFQQALSGIYAQLATRSLYGDNLTMGFMSALSQDYDVEGYGAPLVATRELDYESAEVIRHTSAIWQSGYKGIAGINKILQNLEKNKDVLEVKDYAMLKGEAIALRSLIHFDLYRIFAPAYEGNETNKSIPYKTTTNQNSVPPATAQELISFVLKDLDEAAKLMRDLDPVREDDVNRRIKLNYYGVKALEARVKLYSGDRAGAYIAAKEVLESSKYRFVEQAALSTSDGYKDRLYQTELIFCLRVNDMQNWVDNEYFRSAGAANMRLSQSLYNFNLLYETAEGGATDYRRVYGIEQDGMGWFASKYWQTYQYKDTHFTRLDRMVPVIRYSEMFYIMAESTSDLSESISLLNQVRANRALNELPDDLDQDRVKLEIQKEYLKEFYAEGQIFFFYKRKKSTSMFFLYDEMPLEKYVLPIPELELEFNPNF